MQTRFPYSRVLAMLAGFALLAASHFAAADPPSRVGRLGYLAGPVSFSPAGENDWAQAAINRPLTAGDRLWTDARARAEIQVGGAMIRLDAFTGVTVLNLDDRITQLQLTQGTMNVRVRRLDSTQTVEVDTPNLAFTLRQAGEYRIEVEADGNATTIFVRRGQGEAWGDNAAYLIDARQPYRFMGTNLRDLEYADTPRYDEFDRWCGDRDRRYDNSPSARYVSPDVVGYQDLDANGTWRSDATYGNVWYPTRVSADWAPYRDGHWAWIDPWGWTWVDDAPWGFAVSHYGRWANVRGAWGWIPGPVRSRAYYAPALVAFVGGDNFQLRVSSGNVNGIAWFPLAPREVYRPAYPVSRGYFENINRSNTVINTTVINNTYNNTNVTNVVYVNRQVQGAVIAVPATAFVQSQRVSAVAVRLPATSPATSQAAAQGGTGTPVSWVPRLAPTEKSVHGAAAQSASPPPRVFERPVVARTAPPPVHAGFAAQQSQLAAMPGRPLDEAARRQLKPAATVPAPVVNVIAPAQQAPAAVPPPPAAVAPGTPPQRGTHILPTPPAPAAVPGDTRGKPDERKAAPPVAPAPVISPQAPPVPPQRGTHILPAPPAPAAVPADPRGRPDERKAAPPPAPPAAVVPPAAVTPPPPQIPPQRGPQNRPPQAAPDVAPSPPRGKPDEKREVPPAAPAAVATPPSPASPPQRGTHIQPMPPAQANPPGEQRGRPDAEREQPPVRGPNVAPPVPAPAPQPAPPVAVTPPRAAPPASVPAQAQPPQPLPPQADGRGRPPKTADEKKKEKADKEEKDAKEAKKREDERKQ